MNFDREDDEDCGFDVINPLILKSDGNKMNENIFLTLS